MVYFSTKKAEEIFKYFLTTIVRTPEISDNREVVSTDNREVSPKETTPKNVEKLVMESFHCPYCGSTDFTRRGFRQKLREKVQLYLCSSCQKTFTPNLSKGKHFPMQVVIDAVSIYNLGYSLEQTSQLVQNRCGAYVPPSSLSEWLSEFKELCRFSRMREYALKKCKPKDMVIQATLAHRQLYRYRFHRPKCELIIKDDFKHRRFGPLQEYLEMVPGECPHQYFQVGLRASEAPLTFSKTQMIVRSKHNLANDLCTFALQGVKERKERHESVQKFMLCNDSVTVATEVPVYLNKDDIEHMQTQLGFQIFTKENLKANNDQCTKSNLQSSKRDPFIPVAGGRDDDASVGVSTQNMNNELKIKTCDSNSLKIENCELKISQIPRLVTGHIDILQIRNGQIHILDYKPNADKERPIEQLTLYAMALSRLTGLRLFEFKCAWFDEKDYFEFYPLHVLHKPRSSRRRRKVYTGEGMYRVNKNVHKIEQMRPEDRQAPSSNYSL